MIPKLVKIKKSTLSVNDWLSKLDALPPADYLVHMQSIDGDGCRPLPPWIRLFEGQESEATPCQELLSTLDTLEFQSNLVERLGLPMSQLPIAISSDTGYYLVDSRAEGHVYFWDCYNSSYDRDRQEGNVVVVAHSFSDFMTKFEYPSSAMPWIRFVLENDAKGIEGWLTNGGDANTSDDSVGTPLSCAIIYNMDAVRDVLLEHGARW